MAHDPKTYRYFLLTLDPVHIGTGGTRLGRVDLSIVREPGTRLPKIPGSSLHGAVRAYAAHRYGKPQCAGQGKEHCGQPTCPICYTFGYARDKEGGRAGVVAISDARILLFPVYSMVGPVWVTSPGVLYDAGFRPKENDKARFEVDKNEEGKAKWPRTLSVQDHLNLGWLMVERDKNGSEWKPEDIFKEEIPEPIRNRVALVSDKFFSQIVNSNLEVRTSVAINPETGAAEEGALFTYEAIPRATVLWMDVVVSDYRGEFPNETRLQRWKVDLEGTDEQAKKDLLRKWGLLKKDGSLEESVQKAREWLQAEQMDQNGENWRWKKPEMKIVQQSPVGIVQAGLEWAEYLGVGGMGTRGFGRIRLVQCEPAPQPQTVECKEKTSHGDTGNTGESEE